MNFRVMCAPSRRTQRALKQVFLSARAQFGQRVAHWLGNVEGDEEAHVIYPAP